MGPNTDGRYTVKSGDWLGRMGSGAQLGVLNSQLWNKVWSIQGPSKLRHLLWRVFKGSLPVNVVRFLRHIHNSALCSHCEEEEETICRALIGCADSRDIWLTSSVVSSLNNAPRDSFDNLFLWLHSHVSKGGIISYLCMLMGLLVWAQQAGYGE